MNWLDVVLFLIVAGSVYTSFRKGLSREVIGLISVVVALILGIWFYGSAGAYLLPYLSSRAAANLGGFLLVFCGVMLVGALVSFTVGKFLKVTGLSIFDHLLGAMFGMVRGALISVAILMAVMAFSPKSKPPEAVVNSRLAPYVTRAANFCADMAPYDLKEGFHKTYAEVRTAWRAALEKGIRRPALEKSENEKRI